MVGVVLSVDANRNIVQRDPFPTTRASVDRKRNITTRPGDKETTKEAANPTFRPDLPETRLAT